MERITLMLSLTRTHARTCTHTCTPPSCAVRTRLDRMLSFQRRPPKRFRCSARTRFVPRWVPWLLQIAFLLLLFVLFVCVCVCVCLEACVPPTPSLLHLLLHLLLHSLLHSLILGGQEEHMHLLGQNALSAVQRFATGDRNSGGVSLWAEVDSQVSTAAAFLSVSVLVFLRLAEERCVLLRCDAMRSTHTTAPVCAPCICPGIALAAASLGCGWLQSGSTVSVLGGHTDSPVYRCEGEPLWCNDGKHKLCPCSAMQLCVVETGGGMHQHVDALCPPHTHTHSFTHSLLHSLTHTCTTPLLVHCD